MISFILGIGVGLLNVLFKSTLVTRTLYVGAWGGFFSDIGTFLTSIGCWVMMPYIVARSPLSKTRRKAATNCLLVLAGTMFGYHFGYYYGIRPSWADSLSDFLGLYDYLWFIIACIFGFIFGYLMHPTPFIWKNRKFDLNNWQRCFVFSTCIAESIWWIIWYPNGVFIDYTHLIVELVIGLLFFIISNYNNLKDFKQYLRLFILSIMEFLIILTTYFWLFSFLDYMNAEHPSVFFFN